MLNVQGVNRLELVYRGLKALIERGDGTGFCNCDQGHPSYVAGANGTESPNDQDGPEKNQLFRLLSEACRDEKFRAYAIEGSFPWWHDFSTWQEFCAFAVDAYNLRRDAEGVV